MTNFILGTLMLYCVNPGSQLIQVHPLTQPELETIAKTDKVFHLGRKSAGKDAACKQFTKVEPIAAYIWPAGVEEDFDVDAEEVQYCLDSSDAESPDAQDIAECLSRPN